MKTLRRITVLAVLAVVTGWLALMVCPASAAPPSLENQLIAAILLRQNTNEAQVTLSVPDLGPSHKYGESVFDTGVIIADDAGRLIAIRGEGDIYSQGQTYQVFRFDNAYREMPGKKVIRVTHIFLSVMTGDFAHPTFICSSPSLSIDECLAQWHPE